ncbi:MAG: inositol monophosphatase [Cytophagales bacterium]|nr:inositol monophosphatase [Cytophagales bacterium]
MLQELLHRTIAVAQEAGAFIQAEASSFDFSQVEYKGLNDMVSYVDKTSEKICVAALSQIFPEAGFITEEGTSEKGQSEEYNWVIDPLDGTTNFVHGLPIYSVSIGLIHRGRPVLGVIYDPNRDECFYAAEGGKAYCNGEEIHVSQGAELKRGLIVTGLPASAFVQQDFYMAILKHLMPLAHGLRRTGSAAIDLAYVAAGRFDGQFEYGLKPYDVCAGAAIIQQAGGLVTDFNGGSDYLFGNTIMAACPGVYTELMAEVQKFWVAPQ